MNGALTPLLWFAAVIALIPLVLWLVKRSPIGAAVSSGAMRTVSALPLSASQRVVTVEVGSGDDRRWLVLGVTSHTITTLHTMSPQAQLPEAAPTPQTAFSQLLQRLRQSGGDDHAR